MGINCKKMTKVIDSSFNNHNYIRGLYRSKLIENLFDIYSVPDY